MTSVLTVANTDWDVLLSSPGDWGDHNCDENLHNGNDDDDDDGGDYDDDDDDDWAPLILIETPSHSVEILL